MIYEIPEEQHPELIQLFNHHEYLRLIHQSILHQKIGVVYANAEKNPSAACLKHGPLVFIVGNHKCGEAEELLERIPERHMIWAQNMHWGRLIKEHWDERVRTRPRTKFSSENLTITHMEKILSDIPNGMHLEVLSLELIQKISDQAKGIIGILFPNLDEFMKENFGFCLMKGEKIMSLALAATPFINSEFEIHIETDPDYQKQGLAMIASAALIKYSLENGYIPHWDADNPPSAKLALKLGFSDPEEYETYLWLDQ